MVSGPQTENVGSYRLDRLLGRSSWFLGAEVDDAWDGSWSCHARHGFTWLLSVPTWEVMQAGQPTAYTVLLPMDDRLGCKAP
jgi:hypothetical protein